MSFTKLLKPSVWFSRRSKEKRSSKFVPQSYQSSSIEFGVSRPAAGFFLAPGLGKTMIVLCIFKILKRIGAVDELFVISKRRIVNGVWRQEGSKWKLPFKFVIIHGSAKEKLLYEPADVRLMNFEGLPWLVKQKRWFRRGKKVMLAIDESSKIKNYRTLRFRSLKKILKNFVRRYTMTGSPASKGLMGIFSQTYALDLGETFGPYITAFRNEFFTPTGYMGTDWKLQKGGKKRMFDKLKPLVIRFGDKELNMPPLTFLDKEVDLPKKARQSYDELQREFILQLKKGEITAANAAVATQKLRQAANGAVLYSEAHTKAKYHKLHEEKCEALVDLLEELQGEPALVAYEFKHEIPLIQNYFKNRAPEFKDAPFIGGHTKDHEMEVYQDGWDEGKYPVLFGQTASTGYGLNLQGKGGIVIYFALPWSLEDYEQFYRRVWRQGQTRRVLAYRLLARDTVDQRICEVLESNDHTQQSLLRYMESYHGVR